MVGLLYDTYQYTYFKIHQHDLPKKIIVRIYHFIITNIRFSYMNNKTRIRNLYHLANRVHDTYKSSSFFFINVLINDRIQNTKILF